MECADDACLPAFLVWAWPGLIAGVAMGAGAITHFLAASLSRDRLERRGDVDGTLSLHPALRPLLIVLGLVAMGTYVRCASLGGGGDGLEGFLQPRGRVRPRARGADGAKQRVWVGLDPARPSRASTWRWRTWWCSSLCCQRRCLRCCSSRRSARRRYPPPFRPAGPLTAPAAAVPCVSRSSPPGVRFGKPPRKQSQGGSKIGS
jgi:hypothetical protein